MTVSKGILQAMPQQMDVLMSMNVPKTLTTVQVMPLAIMISGLSYASATQMAIATTPPLEHAMMLMNVRIAMEIAIQPAQTLSVLMPVAVMPVTN